MIAKYKGFMKSKMKYLLLVLFTLAFCSCRRDCNGVVVDKTHQTAYPQFIFNGKTTTTIIHPEKWRVVEDSTGRHSFVVPKDIYNAYNIGDSINIQNNQKVD